MKGIKVIGVGSKPEETEFGMYETCFGYGVVNNPYMILEFPDGSQVAQETYYWDFEDYVEIVVDNVTDFSAWLSEQDLSDEQVEELKNDGTYELIALTNKYNKYNRQLEKTDEDAMDMSDNVVINNKLNRYKLSDETKTISSGNVLHRVVATTTFTLASGITINAGDVGGWIEKKSNLSGNAWVSDDAQVYGDANVSGDALVSGNAQVYGNAKVCGNAAVDGNAVVDSNAKVSGNAEVSGYVTGYARVSGNSTVSDKIEVSGKAEVFDLKETSTVFDIQPTDDAEVSGDVRVVKNRWSNTYNLLKELSDGLNDLNSQDNIQL